MLNPSYLIAPMMKEQEFVKRGSAFFRVYGDGVVQAVRYERERDGFYLYFGLYSMYGELEERWFTSLGCIPRYEVLKLDGIRSLPPPWDRKGLDTNRMQAELLRERGIPFLNGIQTQRELADAIFSLDGRWNDGMKIAPFLSSGEYENAALVLEAIIKQHDFARERNRETLTEADFRQREEFWAPVTAHFCEILEMVRREDPAEIQAWLDKNYAANRAYAKFCMK